MRPKRIGQVRRATISSAVLLGMVLAVGVSATGEEPAAQQQQSGYTGLPPVNGQPTAPGNTSQPGMPRSGDPLDGVPDPAIRAHMQAERLKAVNDDRHKKLVSDVDKLISLTNELKTDVDKTNKDELSLDVMRKAQEIEKLAHDVQSRMKN